MDVPSGLPPSMTSDVSYMYTGYVRINEHFADWGDSLNRMGKINRIERSLKDLGEALTIFKAAMDELSKMSNDHDDTTFRDKKAQPPALGHRLTFFQYCSFVRGAAEKILGEGLYPMLVNRMKDWVDCDPLMANVKNVVPLWKVKEKIAMQQLVSYESMLNADRYLFEIRNEYTAEELALTLKGFEAMKSYIQMAKDLESNVRDLLNKIMEYCDEYAKKKKPSKDTAEGGDKGEAWWKQHTQVISIDRLSSSKDIQSAI